LTVPVDLLFYSSTSAATEHIMPSNTEQLQLVHGLS